MTPKQKAQKKNIEKKKEKKKKKKTKKKQKKKEEKKYIGVGGHLFAIAINASKKNGFDGFITGFASDKKLELHYIEKMNAMHIGQLHPYQFAIDESSANKILEVYTYEWSEDKL